jgi:hypothetical protein
MALTPDQAKAIRLKMHKLAQFSEWLGECIAQPDRKPYAVRYQQIALDELYDTIESLYDQAVSAAKWEMVAALESKAQRRHTDTQQQLT